LRVDVRKTYKLFVGGAFPRSESGRCYPVRSASGEFLANAALASRKDVRDAVRAARAAFAVWPAATAYNRGQVLYRIAELLEGRRSQFVDEVAAAEGCDRAAAESTVAAAVDVLVHYAGWTDKLPAVLGGVNPVAMPFLSFSLPEPTGVVGVVAPDEPALLGLVAEIAPALAAGNTVVAVISERWPLPALDFAEVLGVSDLPGGVVNLLSGRLPELAPWLASHMDVNAIDLTGVTDPTMTIELETAAVENLKRVVRPPAAAEDWTADPGIDRMLAYLETKTVWHPKGL
jgi:acyl-CoA reductase-like NAD-dependent aldehyde dehydrogenase